MSPGQGPKAVFALQRRERIIERLRAEGSVAIREIAAEFGVSDLTIRRDVTALEDQGLVSRVHGGAVLPQPSNAHSTASGSRRPALVIGMVVPSLDYYWPEIIRGARNEAATMNLRIIVRGSLYDAEDNQRQVQALLDTQNIDGLIVAPSTAGEAGHDLLRWLNTLPVPVVLAERRSPVAIPAHRLEWVATDHAFGAGMAVRHLWQQGHKNIGCISDSTSPTSKHVVRGWRLALSALGMDPDKAVHRDSAAGGEDRASHFDDILSLCAATETTGLLIHSDVQAVAFVQHCVDRGIDIPGSLAVVGYDDEVAYLAEPAISAVRPPKQHVGRHAVQLISARLSDGPRRPVHRVELNPDLIIRDSSVSAPGPSHARLPKSAATERSEASHLPKEPER